MRPVKRDKQKTNGSRNAFKYKITHLKVNSHSGDSPNHESRMLHAHSLEEVVSFQLRYALFFGNTICKMNEKENR